MPDETLKLTSLVARSVADAAESQRSAGGEPGFMVTSRDPVSGGWSTQFEPQTELPGPVSNATQVVIPVDTQVVTQRPAVQQVYIRAEGMPAGFLESLTQYDAVFWSESAVEKFVIPYYASKSQWAAAEVLGALSEMFYRLLPAPDRAVEDEPIPFAVAHLPRSTYEGLSETAAMGADLAVIKRHPVTGRVTHHLLSDFLRKREEGRGQKQER